MINTINEMRNCLMNNKFEMKNDVFKIKFDRILELLDVLCTLGVLKSGNTSQVC